MSCNPVCYAQSTRSTSTIQNTPAEADKQTLCEFWWHANDFPTQLYKLMPDKLQIHNVCIPHNPQCHPQMACCIHGPTIRSDCIHSTTFICANPRGVMHARASISEISPLCQKYGWTSTSMHIHHLRQSWGERFVTLSVRLSSVMSTSSPYAHHRKGCVCTASLCCMHWSFGD